MNEIFLDTETTGLSIRDKHRRKWAASQPRRSKRAHQHTIHSKFRIPRNQ